MKKVFLVAAAVAFSSINFNLGASKIASAAQICAGTADGRSANLSEFIIFTRTITDDEIGAEINKLGAENINRGCTSEEIAKLIEEGKTIIARIEARRVEEEFRRQAEEDAKREAEEEAERERLLEEEAKKQAEEEARQKEEELKLKDEEEILKSEDRAQDATNEETVEETSEEKTEDSEQATAPNTGFQQSQNSSMWILIAGFAVLLIATATTIALKKSRK